MKEETLSYSSVGGIGGCGILPVSLVVLKLERDSLLFFALGRINV